MGKYCSCGKYNNYYKYILLAIFFSFLSTVLFGIGYCNDTKAIYFANVYPEKTKETQYTLSHHIIIHNIYRYFGILIISIILYNYEKHNSKSKKNEEIIQKNGTEITFGSDLELIHEESKNKVELKYLLFILLIILLYIIQDILTVFYFQFDLSLLNLWILELPFFSFFNYKLLKIKIYNHHKFALYLSVISCLSTKLMSLLIYKFSENFQDLVYNKHSFLYSIGILSYLIILIIRAYTLTELKIFMDYRYISPNKLLIITGILGLLINIIIMLISSYNKCSTFDDIDIHLCNVDYFNLNNTSNREEAYFENIFIYFKILNDSINIDRYYEIIIEVFTCFFGILIHFCYTYFYFLVIKYLTTIHVIFYSLVYSFSVRIVSLIISHATNTNFSKSPFSLPIFIFTGISDICSGFGICVYCEIFELNFCNFNYNLRRNIIRRGEEDLVIDTKKVSIEFEEIDDGKEDEEENEDSNSVY